MAAADPKHIFSELVCQPHLHAIDSSGVEPLLKEHVSSCVPSGTVLMTLDCASLEPALSGASSVLLRPGESLRYSHGIDPFTTMSTTRVAGALAARRATVLYERRLFLLKKAKALQLARDAVTEAYGALFPADVSEEDAKFSEQLDELRTGLCIRLKKVYSDALECSCIGGRATKAYVEAHRERLLARVAKLQVDRSSVRCDVRKIAHALVIPKLEYSVLKGCADAVERPSLPKDDPPSDCDEPLLPTPPRPSSWVWAPMVSQSFLDAACNEHFVMLSCRLAETVAVFFGVTPEVLLEDHSCSALVPVRMGHTWWAIARARTKRARAKARAAEDHMREFSGTQTIVADADDSDTKTAVEFDHLRKTIEQLESETSRQMLTFWTSDDGQVVEELLRVAAATLREHCEGDLTVVSLADAAIEHVTETLRSIAEDQKGHDSALKGLSARDCVVATHSTATAVTATDAEKLLTGLGQLQPVILNWLTKESLMRPAAPTADRAVVLFNNAGCAPHLFAALCVCRTAITRYLTVNLRVARSVALLIAGYNIDALWSGTALLAIAGIPQPRVVPNLRHIVRAVHLSKPLQPPPEGRPPLEEWCRNFTALRNALEEVELIMGDVAPSARHELVQRAIAAFADAVRGSTGTTLKEIALTRPVREAVRVALFGPETSNLSKVLGRHGTISDRCRFVVRPPKKSPVRGLPRQDHDGVLPQLSTSSTELQFPVDGEDTLFAVVPCLGHSRFELSAIATMSLCEEYLGHPHPKTALRGDGETADCLVQKMLLVFRHAQTLREVLVGMGWTMSADIEQACANVDDSAARGTTTSAAETIMRFVPFSCDRVALLSVPGVVGRGDSGVDAIAAWTRSWVAARGGTTVAIAKLQLVHDNTTDQVVVAVSSSFVLTVVCRAALVLSQPSLSPLVVALAEKLRLIGATTTIYRHRMFVAVLATHIELVTDEYPDTCGAAYWRKPPRVSCECIEGCDVPASECSTGVCHLHDPQLIRGAWGRGPLYPFDLPRSTDELSVSVMSESEFVTLSRIDVESRSED